MSKQDRDTLLSSIWHNQSRIRRFIQTRVPSMVPEEADDFVQETFTAAWENGSKLQHKTESGVLAWLRTVAKRKVIDGVRAANAKKRGGNAKCTGQSTFASLIATPSSFAARSEGSEILAVAMEKLNSRARLAITTRYLEGQPHCETARRLGVSEKAAQMLTKRALVSLREAIGSKSRVL